jgi:hypothetical protein
MASRIFGVLGKKRHAKDTFATRLTEEHGYTRFAFADALREAALKLDPIVSVTGGSYAPGGLPPRTFRLSDWVRTFGWEQAKENDEVRRTLQRMGVGVRDLDPEFWVRVVMDAVDNHLGPVVITDVRFPNEFHAIAQRGGRTVRVVNPRVPVPDDDHVSETALDLYQPRHVVMNAGTIEDLHRHADRIAALS